MHQLKLTELMHNGVARGNVSVECFNNSLSDTIFAIQ